MENMAWVNIGFIGNNVDLSGELLLRSWECYFGVYFPICKNNTRGGAKTVRHDNTCMYIISFITQAPLFPGGEDHVCESPLGDSCFVMNIHNPFMHCVTSQYVFKLRDVIMLMRAVAIVVA